MQCRLNKLFLINGNCKFLDAACDCLSHKYEWTDEAKLGRHATHRCRIDRGSHCNRPLRLHRKKNIKIKHRYFGLAQHNAERAKSCEPNRTLICGPINYGLLWLLSWINPHDPNRSEMRKRNEIAMESIGVINRIKYITFFTMMPNSVAGWNLLPLLIFDWSISGRSFGGIMNSASTSGSGGIWWAIAGQLLDRKSSNSFRMLGRSHATSLQSEIFSRSLAHSIYWCSDLASIYANISRSIVRSCLLGAPVLLSGAWSFSSVAAIIRALLLVFRSTAKSRKSFVRTCVYVITY